MEFLPRFVLAVLATWRLTHLLAREDGPADLLARIRAALGGGFVGKLMDCFPCLSLWVGAAMAPLLSWRPAELLLSWLALSGGACLLERLGQEPVVIQPISPTPEGDMIHGMLRSETSAPQEHLPAHENAGRIRTHP